MAARPRAKDLAARAPWTGPDGPRADLTSGPAAMACAAPPAPINLEKERAVAGVKRAAEEELRQAREREAGERRAWESSLREQLEMCLDRCQCTLKD